MGFPSRMGKSLAHWAVHNSSWKQSVFHSRVWYVNTSYCGNSSATLSCQPESGIDASSFKVTEARDESFQKYSLESETHAHTRTEVLRWCNFSYLVCLLRPGEGVAIRSRALSVWNQLFGKGRFHASCQQRYYSLLNFEVALAILHGLVTRRKTNIGLIRKSSATQCFFYTKKRGERAGYFVK